MANTGTMERVYVSSLKAGDCQTLRVPAASGTYQEGQCANWDSGK